MSEPMTDEQLEEIDEMLHNSQGIPHECGVLLANEVERLRAAVEHEQRQVRIALKMMQLAIEARKRAEAENATMRPIVDAVARGDIAIKDDDGYVYCAFGRRFGCTYDEANGRRASTGHSRKCPVTQARAFVAQHPATAQGEPQQADIPLLRAVVSRSCDRDNHEKCEVPERCDCWCHRQVEAQDGEA